MPGRTYEEITLSASSAIARQTQRSNVRKLSDFCRGASDRRINLVRRDVNEVCREIGNETFELTCLLVPLPCLRFENGNIPSLVWSIITRREGILGKRMHACSARGDGGVAGLQTAG